MFYFGCAWGARVGHLTRNPKVEGSNPATCSKKEEMEKKVLLKIKTFGTCGLYYKNILTIVSDYRNWRLYYKCV